MSRTSTGRDRRIGHSTGWRCARLQAMRRSSSVRNPSAAQVAWGSCPRSASRRTRSASARCPAMTASTTPTVESRPYAKPGEVPQALAVHDLGPTARPGLALDAAEDLAPLVVDSERSRRTGKAHLLQVRQQRVDGGRPRLDGSADGVPDPHHPAAGTVLHHFLTRHARQATQQLGGTESTGLSRNSPCRSLTGDPRLPREGRKTVVTAVHGVEEPHSLPRRSPGYSRSPGARGRGPARSAVSGERAVDRAR